MKSAGINLHFNAPAEPAAVRLSVRLSARPSVLQGRAGRAGGQGRAGRPDRAGQGAGQGGQGRGQIKSKR